MKTLQELQAAVHEAHTDCVIAGERAEALALLPLKSSFQQSCADKIAGEMAKKYEEAIAELAAQGQASTPESREAAYLNNCGAACPFCHSMDISGGGVEIDGPTAWQKVSCGDCGAEWADIYHLTSIEELEQPTTEEDNQ